MLIKGPTVYLRTVREKDLDMLYDFMCDVEGRGPYFPIDITSEATFRKDFQKHGFVHDDDETILLICDPQDTILGVMFVFRATPYFAGLEIGYRLFNRDVHGKGVMTEALMLCSYLLFTWKQINRLELKIIPQNMASRRVAEKCGYTLEGVARECIFLRGQHHDMAIYSLLRSEAPATYEEALSRLPANAP